MVVEVVGQAALVHHSLDRMALPKEHQALSTVQTMKYLRDMNG